ncbi:unnamed protein product [Meganyctiphanes norvegica]|uniref:Uncharacterized protein n=1 Tax=Meganyctiphanes norvegica TaxID=48144 RepID=A0AAV2QC75_MEGNR
MIQRPVLPVLNLEDLIQPTTIKYDDTDIEDPFTDPKDFKDEDLVQRPLGGMPPGFTWCPGGIKKLCLKSKLKKDRGQGRRKSEVGRNRRSRADRKSREEKKLARKARSDRKSRSNRKGKSKKKYNSRKKSGSKRRRKAKRKQEKP